MRLLKFLLVPSGSSASSRSIFLVLTILSFYIISFSSANHSKGSSNVSSKSNKSQSSNHPAKIKGFSPIEDAKARQSSKKQKRFHPVSLNDTDNNANTITISGTKTKAGNKNIPVLVFPTIDSWKTSSNDGWPDSATTEILKNTVTTRNVTRDSGKANKKSKNSTKSVKKELHKTKISIKPTDISHFTYSDIRSNAGLNVPTPTNITVSSSHSQSRFVSTNKPPERTKVSSSSSSTSSSSSSVSSQANPYPLPNHFIPNDKIHEILRVDHSFNLPSPPPYRNHPPPAPAPPYRNEVIYSPPEPSPPYRNEVIYSPPGPAPPYRNEVIYSPPEPSPPYRNEVIYSPPGPSPPYRTEVIRPPPEFVPPYRNDVTYPPPAPYPFPVPVPPRVPLSPYASSPFPDFKWSGFDLGNSFHEESGRAISSQIGPGVRHKGHFGSRPATVISSPTTTHIAVVELDSNEKLSSSSSFEHVSYSNSNSNANIANLNANSNFQDSDSKSKKQKVIKAHGGNKQSIHAKHQNNKEKHKENPKDNDNENHASQENHFYGEPNLPKHAYVSTAGLSPGVDPGPGLLPYFDSTVNHFPMPPPSPLQLRKKSTPDGLVPLDKRIVYISMVFSWIFWCVTFVTYYHWGEKMGHPVPGKPGHYFNHPIIFTVPPDGSKPYFHRRKRSIEGNLPGGRWNFTRVLEMIDIAQKTYEGFDWQSLDCQKKVLCEISHKSNDLGETGRKITTSINYYTGVSDKFIEALQGLPIPQVIQHYLKEYKEAIAVGKQANKDCAQSYPTCKFSLKQLFVNKSIKKSA